jgi:membrane-bound ClpP family serine protease
LVLINLLKKCNMDIEKEIERLKNIGFTSKEIQEELIKQGYDYAEISEKMNHNISGLIFILPTIAQIVFSVILGVLINDFSDQGVLLSMFCIIFFYIPLWIGFYWKNKFCIIVWLILFIVSTIGYIIAIFVTGIFGLFPIVLLFFGSSSNTIKILKNIISSSNLETNNQ